MTPTAPRLTLIDTARGVALIGMVVFHFTFDLEMFGWVAPGTVGQVGWMAFARLVAGSFVFLAGVSMVLAHGDGVRWRSFRRGTALVAVAALGVSVATFFAMPDMFVFFGILHIIAVSRVLGLAFLRVPVAGLLVLGVAIWAAPYLVSFDVFNTRWLAWIGFASVVPLSMDLEPVFPWFGPFLLGMALARVWRPAAGNAGWLAWDWLAAAGRHSLWIYLIHQPVLIGCVWAVTMLLR